MKHLIKKIAIFFLKPIATRLGYTDSQANSLVNHQYSGNKDYLLDNFYNCLQRIGFSPKHIIDVGANHGTWTRKALQHFPNAQFTMLEPQEWLRSSFEDLLSNNTKVIFFPIGAGSENGSFKFTIVDRDDSCSFRISEEEAKKAGYKQIDIPVVTINSLLKQNPTLPTPDIIKVDAEGLDINVIKGASDCFNKTEVFMVEAAVMNKLFSNNLLTMMQYMDSIGYKIFDITDINRTMHDNALWLVELVFIKKSGFIDNSITSY